MANNTTAEQLKVILDEKLDQKLTPFINLNVSELRSKLEDAMSFLELANAQNEKVMAKFKVHDEERMKLQEENKIFKSALHILEGQFCQIQNTKNKFTSYLNARRQTVTLNNIISSKKNMSCGIPQGSVLRPLIFILYINDMHHCSEFFDFHLFADVQIYFRDKPKTTKVDTSSTWHENYKYPPQ